MPFKSEKQRRFMYAAAEGKAKGMSPEDAKSYIAHSTGKSGKRRMAAKRKGKSSR